MNNKIICIYFVIIGMLCLFLFQKIEFLLGAFTCDFLIW